MENFQSVCKRVQKETNQPLRSYSTYNFGRERDENHCSVILDRNEAEKLIEKLQPSLPEGVVLFIGTERWLGDEKHRGVELVIGKGNSQWDILRIARSDACNYEMETEDLIAKLKEYHHKYGIRIFHAETDTIEFDLLTPPHDLQEFCQDLYEFCPDIVDQGCESEEALAEIVDAAQRVLLWWD